MPDNYQSDAGNGTGRLDRIEHIFELVARNQLATNEHHDEDFKKLMTWQVLMQDKFEKLTARMDQQAGMQAALDEPVDKLVIVIGEFICKAEKSQKSPE